jgi:hypothetical protein
MEGEINAILEGFQCKHSSMRQMETTNLNDDFLFLLEEESIFWVYLVSCFLLAILVHGSICGRCKGKEYKSMILDAGFFSHFAPQPTKSKIG